MPRAKQKTIISTIRVVEIDKRAARQLIGQLVKEARKAKGFTQEEACLMLGMTRSNLCNVELGNSGLSTENLIRAIVNLGISLTPETFGAKP